MPDSHTTTQLHPRDTMDIHQLTAFVRVAQLGNFTRAAESLRLTQPAVTRQVAGLEARLGTRLVERLGRRIALTPAGEVLLGYAEQILRLEAEAGHAVAEVTRGGAGSLRVGASSTVATYLLPVLLGKYKLAHPGVELSVLTGGSREVASLVVANAVDIGIVMDLRESRELRAIELGNYASAVVVPPGHRLASTYGDDTGGVPISALYGQPLIVMQRGTSLRRIVDHLLAAGAGEVTAPEDAASTEVAPHGAAIAMELDSVEAIKKMIESGLGISILPRLAVNAEVEAGRLRALPLENADLAQRRIAAIHRTDKFVTAAMRDFLRLVHGELGRVLGR